MELKKEDLYELYIVQNKSQQEIADIYGCYRKTIGKYLNKYNLQKPSNSINREILYDLYITQNKSQEEIAKQYNCSRYKIQHYLTKYNISKYTIELNKELLYDLYITQNKSQQEIANLFSCSRNTVINYLRKYNIVKDKTMINKDELYKLYINEQHTQQEIANIFSCSIDTVGKYLKDYDITKEILSIDRLNDVINNCIKNTGVKPTIKDIAKMTGYSCPYIRKRAADCGIQDKIDYTLTYTEPQKELKTAIENLFVTNGRTIPTIIINDKTVISPKEIDIYLPEYNFGVEFNGGFWHSEAIHDKRYHYTKSKLAEEKHVFIYHVFSYEWNDSEKRKKVLNQIRNILHLNNTRIPARKCNLCEIGAKEQRQITQFLNENHVQGSDKSAIKLGLFYNNEIVAVMTFTRPRFSHKYNWELSRYCTKSGCNVIGGASKLFKYFVDNYLNADETIVSYSDIAKTRGTLYSKLGFSLSHIAAPNYVWWKDDNDYKTRYQCQMKNETNIMQANGYYRIYDCGNKTWVYKKCNPSVSDRNLKDGELFISSSHRTL